MMYIYLYTFSNYNIRSILSIIIFFIYFIYILEKSQSNF